jgi:hypothetical protein
MADEGTNGARDEDTVDIPSTYENFTGGQEERRNFYREDFSQGAKEQRSFSRRALIKASKKTKPYLRCSLLIILPPVLPSSCEFS